MYQKGMKLENYKNNRKYKQLVLEIRKNILNLGKVLLDKLCKQHNIPMQIQLEI